MDNFMKVAQMAGGYQISRILMTAVELEVFDALDGTARSAQDLSKDLACDARGLELLLNALVALNLLNKHRDQFSLTEAAAEYLVSNSPTYYGHMIECDAGHVR